MPLERSRCWTRLVVVVLPLVPVMPHQRWGERSQANSGSPMIRALAARAEPKNSENSEIPGLATQTSKDPWTDSVPYTNVTPISSKARVSSDADEDAPPYTVMESTRSARWRTAQETTSSPVAPWPRTSSENRSGKDMGNPYASWKKQARPSAPNAAAMIQKRMTTLVSAQPSFSK